MWAAFQVSGWHEPRQGGQEVLGGTGPGSTRKAWGSSWMETVDPGCVYNAFGGWGVLRRGE